MEKIKEKTDKEIIEEYLKSVKKYFDEYKKKNKKKK